MNSPSQSSQPQAENMDARRRGWLSRSNGPRYARRVWRQYTSALCRGEVERASRLETKMTRHQQRAARLAYAH